jgi:hypothetical protein
MGSQVIKANLQEASVETGERLDVEIEIRPDALVATLPDGRMVVIEQSGGVLRMLAWNRDSEAPVVTRIEADGEIEAGVLEIRRVGPDEGNNSGETP